MPSMMYVSAHHYVDPGVIHQISSLQVTEITSLSFIRPKKNPHNDQDARQSVWEPEE